MAALTQSLLGGEFAALDVNSLCTIVVFCIVLEGVSVIIGHLAHVGD